jgi:hypothetical protein
MLYESSRWVFIYEKRELPFFLRVPVLISAAHPLDAIITAPQPDVSAISTAKSANAHAV